MVTALKITGAGLLMSAALTACGSGSGSGSGVAAGAGSGVAAGAGSGVAAGAGSGVAASTGSGVGSGAGAGSGSGVAAGSGAGSGVAASAGVTGEIVAVGAENQYANVISQIGGRYVQVSAILSNPNTDPHTFEASASVAKAVSAAKLIVQNGLGYDTFMNKIESASPSSTRKIIDAQTLLGLPDSTQNPHLWYEPAAISAVADAIARDLSQLQPSHAAYFAAGAKRFIFSLKPWLSALDAFANKYPNTPVATTEPVGDYMLEAARTVNRTPFQLQADIMNGVDPAPQDITQQNNLFSQHKVKVFLYNQQVTDSLTRTFLNEAMANHIPVVGLYETMPLHYTYQGWMLAEVHALQKAVADGVSTRSL